MKIAIIAIPVLILFGYQETFAQTVTASFTAPDTVCMSNPVNITNTSTGASTYFWNFCVGNLNNPPAGANLGNIGGNFVGPVYVDYVEENGNYYGFMTDNYAGKLLRLDFGNSLLNTPAVTNLGNLGVIRITVEGLQVIKNEGKWYVIIVGGQVGIYTPECFLIKVELGTNITNPAPVATNLGNLGNMVYPHDLYVFNEGPHWYGLTLNTDNSTITRFDFSTSFDNTPVATNLGNIGSLNGPTGLHAINENGNWYAFITNARSNTITRLDFGNSLLNTPTGQNLGNIGGVMDVPWDIFIIKYCGQLLGYVLNAANGLVKLDFNNSITNNSPATTNFGNIANFSFPHCLSKIFRVGADLYSLVPNVLNSTLSRIQFKGCTNSSIPNSAAQNPSPITYNAPGTYNINLTIDDGLPTQSAFCKQVEVVPPPVQAPTQNLTFCSSAGNKLRIGTGSKNARYLWNTGATSDSIEITTAGTYYVKINRYGCEATDTIRVRCTTTTGPTAGGVINDYTEVLAYNPCNNSLQVTNASAFKVGDTVLLIQMKGAVIDSTQTALFGTITDYKNAGNYEFNYVKAKTGNSIELKNILSRQYMIPDGKVQLVRVPYYEDLTITSTLTCLPWDGGKGGILAFNVKNGIVLNADLDVSGKGFRGGTGFNTNQNLTNCNQNYYFLPLSNRLGAQKGESIAGISDNISSGKGPSAGGGGGGLDHNSGGGGGSNGGAGGFGGYQWEPCTNGMFDNRGIGGKILTYNNGVNKIFLGSGGGAGHQNNAGNPPMSGGNGGGIIVVSAQSITTGSSKIISNGAGAQGCTIVGTNDCHDAMSGGGSGGTILLDISQFLDNTNIENKGGKGGDMSGSAPLYGRIGPGGGGGGGVLWLKSAAMPGNVINTNTGGDRGVLLTDGNNPWGTTPGSPGISVFGLLLPIDATPFKKNIDSVRIGMTRVSCTSFDLKGLEYTQTSPIINWQWTFGDNTSGTSQNVSHTYANAGNYTIKLVGTDGIGCKDSATINITIGGLPFDFSFKQDKCDPLSVQFTGEGNNLTGAFWSFGDGNSITNNPSPVHVFAAQGDYLIKFTVQNNSCSDTVRKLVPVRITNEDMIITPDTTICIGATKQLRTNSSLGFCWNPATYLDNPNSPNPITSTPQTIKYYFTAEVPGNNLIVNGNFTAGNTGFTSEYIFENPNTTEGTYFIGPNPQAWNGGMNKCGDHTTGTGNMMLVNGSPVSNANVWKQQITVTPNTNYAFSTWIEALGNPNPAQLEFSINGINIGNQISASLPPCTWTQFYATWNSGNSTTATISIVNMNIIRDGNDFALDDISFAPVLIKRDSVTITVDNPLVKVNKDTTVCSGSPVPLLATGAASYSWAPATGLSATNIPNPVATPATAGTVMQIIVTGTALSGCTAKDTVLVSSFVKPTIGKTKDTTICKYIPLQLFVTGGQTYLWSPAATLNNPTSAVPVANPVSSTTMYYVQITDANNCTYKDSVKVTQRARPAFTANGNVATCEGIPASLVASGGDTYTWTPAASLDNPSIANPKAFIDVNTQFSVYIRENNCLYDTTIAVFATVNPNPVVTAQKSNDIDCASPTAQLSASGAGSYLWSPAAGLDDPGKRDPVAGIDTTTTFIVQGTNQFGCTAEDAITVKVTQENKPVFAVPNAFTPNGDRINQCFGIRKWGNATILEFSVYNRWGEKIFTTTNPAQCWDGTYKGKLQDPGGYVYVIRARTFCGEIKRTGMVMLIR